MNNQRPSRRRPRRKPDDNQPAPNAKPTPDPRLAITPEYLARKDAEIAALFDRLFPVDPVTGRIGNPIGEFKLKITLEDLARKDAEAAQILDRLVAPKPAPNPVNQDEEATD
jgi:hypothetical protein